MNDDSTTPAGSNADQGDRPDLSRPRPAPKYGLYAPGYGPEGQVAQAAESGAAAGPAASPVSAANGAIPAGAATGQGDASGAPSGIGQTYDPSRYVSAASGADPRVGESYGAAQRGVQQPGEWPSGPVPSPRYDQSSGPMLPAGQRTDGVSVASLVLGIFSVVTFLQLFGLPGIAAIVCGHIGLRRTRRTGAQGRGMALAGLVMGYITAIIGLLFLVLAVVLVVILLNDPTALDGVLPPDQLQQLNQEFDEFQA